MRFDLFSSGRLYEALKEAKYPDLPAERTLRDWIKNDSAPESARIAVARILSLDNKKEPRPEWAEALPKDVADEVIRRLGDVPGVVTGAAAELGLGGQSPGEQLPAAGEAPPGKPRKALRRKSKRASK